MAIVISSAQINSLKFSTGLAVSYVGGRRLIRNSQRPRAGEPAGRAGEEEGGENYYFSCLQLLKEETGAFAAFSEPELMTPHRPPLPE